MGACATKPKMKADEADAPLPEAAEEIVKNAEEVKVEEKPNLNNVAEKLVLDDEKQQSLASLLVQKEAVTAVEVLPEAKKENAKAEEAKAEPAKEVTEIAATGNDEK